MSYNEDLLIVVQLAYIILGILTSGLVGSVGCGIWLFLCRGTAKFHVKDAMKYLKLTLVGFLFPMIPFIVYPAMKMQGEMGGTYMVKTMLTVMMCIVALWILVAIFVFAKRVLHYILLCRSCSYNIPVEDELVLEEIERWKKTLHIRSRVSVHINAEIASPCIIYHWGYRILLPAYEMTQLEMSMAVLHELVHLKHNDVMIKNLCILVNIIHAFNPFSRYLQRQVEKWVEVLCDLTTCEVGKDSFTRQDYYYGIMQLMEKAESDNKNDAMLAMYEDVSLLSFRVDMFKEANKEGQQRLKGVFYVVLVIMILVTGFSLKATVTATEVWYENSLVAESQEELQVLPEYKETTYEEMYRDTKITNVGTYKLGDVIEGDYEIQPGEMITFRVDGDDVTRVSVHVFCEENICVIGTTDGEKAIYLDDTNIGIGIFESKTNIKEVFMKNENDKVLELKGYITLKNE